MAVSGQGGMRTGVGTASCCTGPEGCGEGVESLLSVPSPRGGFGAGEEGDPSLCETLTVGTGQHPEAAIRVRWNGAIKQTGWRVGSRFLTVGVRGYSTGKGRRLEESIC